MVKDERRTLMIEEEANRAAAHQKSPDDFNRPTRWFLVALEKYFADKFTEFSVNTAICVFSTDDDFVAGGNMSKTHLAACQTCSFLPEDTSTILLLIQMTQKMFDCPHCLRDCLIHEFAHSLWHLRKLAKMDSASKRVAHLNRKFAPEEDHDNFWGECYSAVWRIWNSATTAYWAAQSSHPELMLLAPAE